MRSAVAIPIDTLPAALDSGYTGPGMCVDGFTDYAIAIKWTGTIAGTFKLQASNDNVDFSDLTGSSTTITTGGGTYGWNQSAAGYTYVRVVFTQSSGSGNLTKQLFSAKARH